jgi:hypothetical protein
MIKFLKRGLEYIMDVFGCIPKSTIEYEFVNIEFGISHAKTPL